MSHGGPVHIRRALPREANAVASLAASTFVEAFGSGNTADDLRMHLAEHCSPASLVRELADPGWVTLVAETAGEMCGYAQLCQAAPPPPATSEPALQLYRFYVEKARWGSGLAQQLLAAAVEEARARGARLLWLTTWDRNGRGLAFYRKCGFEVTGKTTFIVGRDQQQDFVLGLSLD